VGVLQAQAQATPEAYLPAFDQIRQRPRRLRFHRALAAWDAISLRRSAVRIELRRRTIATALRFLRGTGLSFGIDPP